MRRMSPLGLDLVIIGVYFAIIIGIGVHFSRRNKDVSEFALGGRSIPWWAVLASILASEISAGTFFGTPGEGFRLRNYTYAQLMAGYTPARASELSSTQLEIDFLPGPTRAVGQRRR